MKFSGLLLAALLPMCACNSATSSKSVVDSDSDSVATELPAPEPEENSVVVELTDNNLPVPVSLPAVIDCWAPWCGPCMKFKPTYHEVAQEYIDKADFFAANVDENSSATKLLDNLKVEGIPTVVILYPGGDEKHFTGLMSADEFRQFLNENL